MSKLKSEEIDDMLKKARHFLKEEGIRFVAIDVDDYKQNKGFIDFSTHSGYRR